MVNGKKLLSMYSSRIGVPNLLESSSISISVSVSIITYNGLVVGRFNDADLCLISWLPFWTFRKLFSEELLERENNMSCMSTACPHPLFSRTERWHYYLLASPEDKIITFSPAMRYYFQIDCLTLQRRQS
jgi:hypothetical protein